MSKYENETFNGKRLGDLTRDELIDALYFSLIQIKHASAPYVWTPDGEASMGRGGGGGLPKPDAP